MAKTKKKISSEPDSAYLLKLVLYLVLGAQWLFFHTSSGRVPIPVGVLIGIVFAMHEHFQIDRKVEYGILLVAMLVGFFNQVGIFIS